MILGDLCIQIGYILATKATLATWQQMSRKVTEASQKVAYRKYKSGQNRSKLIAYLGLGTAWMCDHSRRCSSYNTRKEYKYKWQSNTNKDTRQIWIFNLNVLYKDVYKYRANTNTNKDTYKYRAYRHEICQTFYTSRLLTKKNLPESA